MTAHATTSLHWDLGHSSPWQPLWWTRPLTSQSTSPSSGDDLDLVGCPSLRLLTATDSVLLPAFLRLFTRLPRATVGAMVHCLALWSVPITPPGPFAQLGRHERVPLPRKKPLATGSSPAFTRAVDQALTRMADAGMYVMTRQWEIRLLLMTVMSTG